MRIEFSEPPSKSADTNGVSAREFDEETLGFAGDPPDWFPLATREGDAVEESEEEECSIVRDLLESFIVATLLEREHKMKEYLDKKDPQAFLCWQGVRGIEKEFSQERAASLKQVCKEFRMSKMHSKCSAAIDPSIRGFNPGVQQARREEDQKLWNCPAYESMHEKFQKLDQKLVVQLLQEFETHGFAGDPPDWFPLATFSRQALKNHTRVSQPPKRWPEFVEYAAIFWNKGILYGYWNGNRTGNARLSLEHDIPRPGEGYGQWFLKLGGFPSPNHRDNNGWAAVHHAADQSVCLKCCAFACEDLIQMTHPDILAQPVNRDAGPGGGFQLTHFMASAVDTHNLRVRVMKALLKMRVVDIDARTVHPPHNTPSLLAAGCGFGSMLTLLLDNGADPKVKNSKGKGLWQLGKCCSGTTKEICVLSKAPPTNAGGKEAKYKDTTMTTSKLLRRARNSSTNRPRPQEYW